MATRPPGKRDLWLFLITVPFWTNLLIRTFAILEVIRNEGIINNVLIWSGLIDEPLRILFVGVVIQAILLGALVQSGRASVIVAIVVVLLLFIGALIIERLVDTPREAVEKTLFAIAADLERNDPNVISEHISATVPRLREQAQNQLVRIEVTQASVKGKPEISFSSVDSRQDKSRSLGLDASP